ncbi:hypothetical protein GQ600_24909 [Phytophthora cactorum]|nr:hypothetical protein GQ600_24909 [Phytophthora cactorum]
MPTWIATTFRLCLIDANPIHRSLSWRSAPHICGTSLEKLRSEGNYGIGEKMIMKRVVDVGNVGEVAACIFLLLAMDAAMMKGSTRSAFIFAASFVQ